MVVEPYPSEKYEFVSWDDELPQKKIGQKNVPNHDQPDDGLGMESENIPVGMENACDNWAHLGALLLDADVWQPVLHHGPQSNATGVYSSGTIEIVRWFHMPLSTQTSSHFYVNSRPANYHQLIIQSE